MRIPDPAFYFAASPDSAFHSDADQDPDFHYDADPDPAFHFDADPDPTFPSDADPDPTFPSDADPDPTYLSDADPYSTTNFFPISTLNAPKWPSNACTFSLWCGPGSSFPLWCGSFFPKWRGSMRIRSRNTAATSSGSEPNSKLQKMEKSPQISVSGFSILVTVKLGPNLDPESRTATCKGPVEYLLPKNLFHNLQLV
jgi:hypothetical protein